MPTTENRMYEGVKTWNPHVGCKFECKYCIPSFQRQAKRRRKWCEACYDYVPHFHPERLNKFPSSDIIFACAYGDVNWATSNSVEAILNAIASKPEKTFYLQSKNPGIFLTWEELFSIPENVIFGTTIETDLRVFDTPSEYRSYAEISFAPHPLDRAETMIRLMRKKYVTIEPILDFSSPKAFAELIEKIAPQFVYVGYDNHNCRLPEPPLSKTLELIDELEKFTEVRLKTVREAWWTTL